MTQHTTEELIIEGIRDRKGRNITVVDMSAIEAAPVAKFIIAEGTSTMQVGAIADSVRDYALKNGKLKPYNYDGYTNSEWTMETLWSTFSCPKPVRAIASRSCGATP